MSSVEAIMAAIHKLSVKERAELERALHGGVDDEWDRQMKADAAAGRFDAILKQVDEEIDSENLRDLP